MSVRVDNADSESLESRHLENTRGQAMSAACHATGFLLMRGLCRRCQFYALSSAAIAFVRRLASWDVVHSELTCIKMHKIREIVWWTCAQDTHCIMGP
jgi:hypothetical protein